MLNLSNILNRKTPHGRKSTTWTKKKGGRRTTSLFTSQGIQLLSYINEKKKRFYTRFR